jgi:hypothetical protein
MLLGFYPMELTVIIPYDKEINQLKFTNLDFNMEQGGNRSKQEKIIIRNKSNDSFMVERRTDNGVSGSGKIYTVGYTVEKNKDAMVNKFKALSFKTYQQGLILPFDVPEFTEQNLLDYIVRQPVYLNLDLNSPYNTESTYANFMRLAEKARTFPGETDPVTGKVYKDKFVLANKYGKLTFYLDIFPYHNGSKAVIHMLVPGTFTSANTVDFGKIIREIKGQLEGIVNS